VFAKPADHYSCGQSKPVTFLPKNGLWKMKTHSTAEKSEFFAARICQKNVKKLKF
jgi:hypothetical protein